MIIRDKNLPGCVINGYVSYQCAGSEKMLPSKETHNGGYLGPNHEAMGSGGLSRSRLSDLREVGTHHLGWRLPVRMTIAQSIVFDFVE